jgi:hypothetical protein
MRDFNLPWPCPNQNWPENQNELRGRKWRKIADKFQKDTSRARERLTIKHRADWLACIN